MNPSLPSVHATGPEEGLESYRGQALSRRQAVISLALSSLCLIISSLLAPLISRSDAGAWKLLRSQFLRDVQTLHGPHSVTSQVPSTAAEFRRQRLLIKRRVSIHQFQPPSLLPRLLWPLLDSLLAAQCPEITVESALKDHPIGHKKCVLSRQVVFGNRYNYTEMWDLLQGISGLSSQLFSQKCSLKRDYTVLWSMLDSQLSVQCRHFLFTLKLLAVLDLGTEFYAIHFQDRWLLFRLGHKKFRCLIIVHIYF